MLTRNRRIAILIAGIGLTCSPVLAQDDTDEAAAGETTQGDNALDDVFANDEGTGASAVDEQVPQGEEAPLAPAAVSPAIPDNAPAPPVQPAPAAPGIADAATSGSEGFFDDVRLSVGTGPMPINTLTAGVAGLGTRLYKPHDKGLLFAGLSHVGGNIAEYDEGERDERWVNGVRGTALSGGYRFENGVGSDAKAIPYGLVGGMLLVSGTKDGTPDDGYWKTSVNLLGAMGGVGIDAALTPVLSLGAEFGGIALFGFGKTKNRDGDLTGKNSESILSTYAAVQATVRR